MTDALLVKPAVWTSRRHRPVVQQMVARGAVLLRGHDSASLRAEIATRTDVTRVVACGGDGTVHLAVNSGAGQGVALGVVPMGTGNDFARHLGLRTTAIALEALASGTTRDLDLGVIECRDAAPRLYAGIASCGFDAQVNERANGYPGPQGTAKYLAAVVGEIRQLAALDLRVGLDGSYVAGRYTLIAVGNSTSYGGGMRVCPDAASDDGVLDVTGVAEVPRRTLLRVLPRVFSGTHVRHPAVSQHRARVVEVSGPDFPVYADGERVGRGPVRFRLLPGALRVVVPA